jgi:hypothetical protein
VAFKFPPLVKRAIGLRFLSMLKSDDVSIDPALKVLSLQLIVIPLFAATFESSRRELISVVVDDVVVKQLMASALDTSALYHYPEALRVELLRLATLLIEHLGRELVDHRKELIKFAWNHLKSEHSTSKMWAYVNVSRFISVYETPPKIILQVYVALLRAYQPESRELVQTALDVLVPSLPRRLPASEFVKAIKWTKKIMFEEGYALPVLVHIFGLIVRHPALFYAHQAQFVPQMVQFFNRLGRFPNAALENRKLAVSLVSLMLDWETHRRDRLHSGGEATAATAAAAGEATAAAAAASAENHTAPDAETTTTAVATTSAAAPAAAAENEFTLPLGMIDVVVNFLTRLALFTAEHKVRLIVYDDYRTSFLLIFHNALVVARTVFMIHFLSPMITSCAYVVCSRLLSVSIFISGAIFRHLSLGPQCAAHHSPLRKIARRGVTCVARRAPLCQVFVPRAGAQQPSARPLVVVVVW